MTTFWFYLFATFHRVFAKGVFLFFKIIFLLLFKCGSNFLRCMKKLDIRCRYWVLITKNTKLEKILTIEKMTPQGGTLGAAEVEKNFLSKFCKQTIYSEFIWGPHHKKHKIRKNLNNRKNDPPRGDPWTPKMLISQVLSFEPGHPYFLSIF